MLKLYNKQLQLKAYLENAFKISYTQQFNAIWTAAFSLPFDDPKNNEIKALDFLELFDNGKRIGMFRIIPIETVKNENEKTITYKCEHVLATLLSDVLFRYHQMSNYTTREVLEYLLSQQEIKHWRLGKCDFVRYFHYSWENENTLLGPIFSVPKPFDEQYAWTWDDSIENYPWTLNLEKASTEITGEIRHRKNLKGIKRTNDPTDIITRLYLLGYGEGVNQLDITKVNLTGLPYIEAPAHIIEEYGIQKYIWVDKRFENADMLFSSGQAFLNKKSTPKVMYAVESSDYELIDPYKVEKYEVGKLVRIDDDDLGIIDVRLMKKGKSDVTGRPLDMSLGIGDILEDLGTTQADIEKRQQINELYSQGATNIDSRDFQDNCDPDHPAVIRFKIPDDVVNINEMILTFETQKFRAYERAIKGGGAVVSSTAAGGGLTQTSSSGGGSTQTSSSGGGSIQTSSTGGQSTVTSAGGGGATVTSSSYVEQHLMSGVPQNSVGTENWGYHMHEVVIPGHNHSVDIPSHTHSVSVPAHTHNLNIPSHTHDVTIPNHTHDITIPPHKHDITLPDHTHAIEFGIFELNDTPSKVTITVDGTTIPFDSTSGDNINLVPYLTKDSSGNIQRGRYAEIKITPDNLARINATVTSRLFIQSRKGGKF
ncbi:hypothetical protein CN326_13990 [Bacillus sp. AFS018417]|uniref:phage tail spike protein n=1 Tax=Bacillus sp. AFS018417 TaxID=2033491 RepID=UPI000BF6935E|nr:phage tail spike protein [Bacillus sp. AFS018417]PEZ05569.1 hypothetical protein CN326_13990 [Bacillus sp. AFS018417]